MAYTEPNVLIHQVLEPEPVSTPREQPAHILAPAAHLARYSDADEKPGIDIGYYDEAVDVCRDWPGIPDGAKPDSTYTKLFIDDALLRYFVGSDDIVTVSQSRNSVRASTRSFKDNGAGFPLSSEFLGRDVKIGDAARVRAVVDGDEYVLWTSVADITADTVASAVAAPTADAGNKATQVDPAVTDDQVAGSVNCVSVQATSDLGYNGMADGDINETYRVRVVEGSVDGDATTARLLVTSASGNDDQGEITPSAFDAETTIGTRGLKVTWGLNEDGCSSSAEDAGYPANDFIVGQEWEFTCGQAYTKPTLASSGSYSGEADTIYVITVTKGGGFQPNDETAAQITCTTVSGTDFSGPTYVTGSGTPIQVGTKGIAIAFTGTQLPKGDQFYISVTAASKGNYRTLAFAHSLPQAVIDEGSMAVSLSLYMKKNIEVPRLRRDETTDVNWTQSETEFCTKAGMTVYDAEWVDDGLPIPLEVFSEESMAWGRMYLEYRAWLPTFCNNVFTLESIGTIHDDIPGPLSPDNPLKYGVYWAKQLSGGVPVRFTGVCDPNDLDSWLDAMSYMENRRDIYGVVPVTRDADVLAAVYGHVNEQSSAVVGCRRVVWMNQAIPDSAAVVSAETSSDDEEVLAVVEDDPNTSGTQYTYVRVTSGNAELVTAGVRPGDVVRMLYSTNLYGDVTYTERVVDAVVNQDTVRLSTSLGAPVNVARKIEIWRNLNVEDKTDRLIAAKSFDDRRVRVVLPDSFTLGDEEIDGLYLTCALAGLSSGVEPHQGLTRYPINGITGVPKMSQFKRSQLNRLADAGFWLVVEDKQSGTVWTRHALTSVTRDDANFREEAITRNLDNISMQSYDILVPYLGVANNVAASRRYISLALEGLYQQMRSVVTNALLGPQMTELTELTVEPHPTLKNNVIITTRALLPYAINEIEDFIIV